MADGGENDNIIKIRHAQLVFLFLPNALDPQNIILASCMWKVCVCEHEL